MAGRRILFIGLAAAVVMEGGPWLGACEGDRGDSCGVALFQLKLSSVRGAGAGAAEVAVQECYWSEVDVYSDGHPFPELDRSNPRVRIVARLEPDGGAHGCR